MKTITAAFPRCLRFYCRALLCVFCLLPALCQAQTTYHVRMNTSALLGRGTFVLDFQLLDGSGLYGNGNATVEITNFTLNGGTLGTILPPYGNVTGSLQDILTLVDGSLNDGLADFAREFSVTSSQSEIHFDLRLHSTSVDSPVPDTFALFVLDSSLFPLATNGPYGVEMVSADFTTTTPVPLGYMTLDAPLLVAEVTQPTNSLSSVTLNTFATSGTHPATGTVKLNTPAPTGGTVVTLTSNLPGVASVPATVTVPASAKTATFPVQTYGVAADTDVTFTARVGSVNRTVTLTVQPLLQSLTLSANAACGAQSLTGTVTLHHPNPAQATTVQLSSGYSGVSLPASVSVPATQVTANFNITVAEPESVNALLLYANAAASTASAMLTILPDPMYTLTDLGTLGGFNSVATGINGAGQVVGYSETAVGDTHAFRYQNNIMTDLDTLGGLHSYARAINAEGSIVGESETAFGDTLAFLYTGTMTDLGTFGGLHSHGRAINTYGQTAGDAETALGETRAFLRRLDTLLDLGTLGGSSSRAFGLTDTGVVVGESEIANADTHAFLWQNGMMTDLGTLGGANSTAVAISSLGGIVGYSETSGGDTHAFLYRNATLTDLGAPGGQNSAARALNRFGQVVGTGQNTFGDDVAFLACEGRMHDLNTRVGNASDWTLTEATGINERGQIVGKGLLFGDTRAFLLTPVPPAQPLPVVSGTVSLEDCFHCAQTLTFTFRSPQGQPLFSQTLALNSDGSFTLRGVPAGNYLLAIHGDRWLQRVVPINTTNGNITNFSTLLLAGDANGDNSVDVFDLDLIVQAFNSDPNVSYWNPFADFNCDLSVDVFDLDLLIRNFNANGDP